MKIIAAHTKRASVLRAKAEKYLELQKQIDKLKREQDAIKEEVKSLYADVDFSEDKSILIDAGGEHNFMLTKSVRTTLDTTRIKKEPPEIAEKYSKVIESISLKVK